MKAGFPAFLFAMNYLGHLYFSNYNPELALANLFGDFVKGSDLNHFSVIQQNGIRLHREIDYFMDQHPAVKACIALIRGDLPKVAPIAMDLYFDHLLAKNWIEFSKIELPTFLNEFYLVAQVAMHNYPFSFQEFINALVNYNWISHYQFEEGLHKMCNGVAQKLSFESTLTNGLAIYKKHETIIQTAFYEYMSDANEHFLIHHSR